MGKKLRRSGEGVSEKGEGLIFRTSSQFRSLRVSLLETPGTQATRLSACKVGEDIETRGIRG